MGFPFLAIPAILGGLSSLKNLLSSSGSGRGGSNYPGLNFAPLPGPTAFGPQYQELAGQFQKWASEGIPQQYRDQYMGRAGRDLSLAAQGQKEDLRASLAARGLERGGPGLALENRIDIGRMGGMENLFSNLAGMDLNTRLSALQGLSGLFSGERGTQVQENLGLAGLETQRGLGTAQFGLQQQQFDWSKPGAIDYFMSILSSLGPTALQALLGSGGKTNTTTTGYGSVFSDPRFRLPAWK